ncbi:MAG: hypothetical protein V4660_19100 [Pseudomonadota bacterium]
MKLFKQFTLLRLYIAICAMALSAFTYAEYYGYLLTGSDESTQKTSGGHHYNSGSRTHHK